MSESDDAKDLPPTPRQIEKLFGEGKAPRSPTMGVFVPLGGGALLVMALWPMVSLREVFAAGFYGELSMEVFIPLFATISAALLVVLALSLGAQRIFGPIVFKPENAAIKFSKLDVIKNAKQKYGPSGLLDFSLRATAGVIYVVFAVAVVVYIVSPFDVVDVAPRLSVHALSKKIALFLSLLAVFAIVFSALEYLVKRVQFMNQHKMSFEDIKREHKDSEISNEVKQERSKRALERMKKIGLENVETADVVMVNPTHVAIAIKWNRAAKDVPVCVARGSDEMAFAIRRLAREHRVPMYKDVPNTRRIFADLQVGDPILPDHFQAVAAAIAYADDLKQHVQPAL